MNNEEDRGEDVYHDERDITGHDFEFLIRRVRDYEFSDDFDISKSDYQDVLTPNTLEITDFKLLEYEFCEYKIQNSIVNIVSEFAGIQIVIENNGIEREAVKKILGEIRNNIQEYTKHSAQILEV